MKGFQEFITEGRDAPLYHATSAEIAYKIIGDNLFDHLETGHIVKGLMLRPRYLPMSSSLGRNLYVSRTPEHSRILGVSFTRSWMYAKKFYKTRNFPYVVLTVDQTRLAQRHKIIPIDYSQHGDFESHMVDRRDEHEEFVVGQIRNARQYILKVDCFIPSWISQSKDAQNLAVQCNKYGIKIENHYV